ncbi:MAG: rhomboid family intramembrane serine protease [Chloroflexota bacterium]|nr:rhomboid family intramembrane serine protease [Chloroflexota bacterium]
MYQRYRRPEAYAVLALIAVNLIFFIVTLINRELISTLWLQPAVWTREPWTLLTSMFVHSIPSNFPLSWHLIANMFTLYFLGTYLCNIVRDTRFLIVYFVGGIIGGFFYIWLGDPYTPVIGASGAIFAVAGALTTIAPKIRVIVFPIPAPVPLWVAIIGIALIISFFPGVAWQAHLGGLVVGLISGFIFRKQKRNIFFF